MRGQLLKRALGSVEFLGFVLFVFCVVFPPFDDISEVNLSLHMLQHVLIVASGFMVAYPLRQRGSLRAIGGRPAGLAALAVVCVVFVYWHLPGPWDDAVLNPLVHAAEHFSFFVGGFLIGASVIGLSDSAKIGALLLAFFGHMIYAVVLISPWNIQVYPLYSLGQQALLGWILLVTGGVFLVGVAYVLYRNPDWLQGSGAVTRGPPAVRAPKKPARGGRLVVPATSAMLIVVLVVYFGATSVAVAFQPATTSPKSSVVYIAETPVSWQYSPQNIRVVIGVNNTVTWVSHSIAYDTVTGDNSSMSSGTIAPGGTYSFTFTDPGTYGYRCLFHPWMTGTVTVLG